MSRRAALSSRAAELFAQQQKRDHVFTDRLFAGLMVIQFIGCVATAIFVSPRTWIGAESALHVHVWAAIGLGAGLCALPVVLAITRPGSALCRHVIAIAQVMFSALLIHLMGGRIEAHFHVFGSLAFLACYKDISVLLTATVVVAADHMFRGLFWPESVFGILSAARWRWLEHAAWVGFEDVFLLISIARVRKQAWSLSYATAALERQNEEVQSQVELRTRELAEALTAAQNADRAKSDFLANMSHEIRTPMTAILGYADLLGGDLADDPEKSAHAALSIRSNAGHLLTIINDILDVSRIEDGQMRVETIGTNPTKIVEEVASLVGPRAHGKGIAVRVRYESPIPDTILSDPTRLRQILLNLTGNALKFTEKGTITIHTSCDPEAQLMRFSVIDTGIGMTPEQCDTVSRFESFTQADSSVTRQFGGSGLGLRISSGLATMLGGGIEVESVAGEGSTFTLTIETGSLGASRMIDPAQSSALTATPRRDPAADTRSSAERQQLDGVRILLAEDGPDNQMLISFHLRKAGAEVTICENGRIAAEAIEDATEGRRPHIVLMDMQMPELDGYSATRRLRAAGCRLPIVALTAHAMDGDRQKCLDAGCDDYLTKPVDRVTLVETCMAWLEQTAADRAEDAA